MKVEFQKSGFVDEEIYKRHVTSVFRDARPKGSAGHPLLHLNDSHSSRSGFRAAKVLIPIMAHMHVQTQFGQSHTTTFTQSNDRGTALIISITLILVETWSRINLQFLFG